MLEERLQCVTAAEPEEQWKQMKTKLQETTAEVVGLSTRKTKKKQTKKKDWFEDAGKEIQELPRFPGGNRNIVGYKTQAFDFFRRKSPLELCSYRLCSNYFEENSLCILTRTARRTPKLIKVAHNMLTSCHLAHDNDYTMYLL